MALKVSNLPSAEGYYQRELSRGTFNRLDMAYYFFGGKEQYDRFLRFRALFDNDPIYNVEDEEYLDREAQLLLAVKRAMRTFEIIKANRDLLAAHSPIHGPGGTHMGYLSGNLSGITDHYALFVKTIMMQGSPEQVREWLPKAINLEIIGTYGQTELGHGSNVRALESTATYDEASDTIVIDMPTITAMKWWPGALGLLATHAVVYCRLFVNGKDLGYHAIMVQIRDEHHNPLPGVEVGDIGPKMGGNYMDGGYLMLRKVRVPRTNMLSKFQQLAKGGAYTQAPAHLAKIAYMTMVSARVLLTFGAAGYLMKAMKIVVRYTLFRQQGFVDNAKGIVGGEKAILDHCILQSRIFPIVSTAWAILFSCRRLFALMEDFEAKVKKAGKALESIDVSMLPELHATSAGMKAFCTEMALNGMEEGRRCCGGQGFTLSSGIAQLVLDYTPNVTYEGDRLPMALQVARVLLGAYSGKVAKAGSFAYLARRGNTTLGSVEDTADLQHLKAVWETVARNAVASAAKKVYFSMKTKPYGEAWNNNHVALIRASQAHTLFQLVDAFVETVPKLPEGCRRVFGALCQIFALSKLSEIPAVVSQLSPAQGATIDRALKGLWKEVRPDALNIVEIIDQPPRMLHHSCIARQDGKVYEALVDWAKRSPLNRDEYRKSVYEVIAPKLNKEYLAKCSADYRALNPPSKL